MSWWLFFAVLGMAVSIVIAVLALIFLLIVILALTEAVHGGNREDSRLRPDD